MTVTPLKAEKPVRKSITDTKRIGLWVALLIAAVPLILAGSLVWSVSVRWKFVDSAWKGDIGTVRAMLDRGMDPDIVSHIGGIRAISMAASDNHVDIVRLLLAYGANPTYGLPQAILKNHVPIVQLLIKHGANVQHWQGYQQSPLQFAAERGNNEVIRLLKAVGAK